MTRPLLALAEREAITPHQTKPSLCDKLAAFFRRYPGIWLDGRQLATVAGFYAYRTRVSDLRRDPYRMHIDNRVRRVQAANGMTVLVSEYRYQPEA